MTPSLESSLIDSQQYTTIQMDNTSDIVQTSLEPILIYDKYSGKDLLVKVIKSLFNIDQIQFNDILFMFYKQYSKLIILKLLIILIILI